MTPTEFVRWLPSQGVRIARKNLYETYLGATARHPIERNADGKVHRLKALELIRVVGSREPAVLNDAIAKRQEADARARIAQAMMLELEAKKEAGAAVDLSLVQKVWGKLLANLKGALRSMAKSAVLEMEGQNAQQREETLNRRHEDALRNMSAMYARLAEAKAG